MRKCSSQTKQPPTLHVRHVLDSCLQEWMCGQNHVTVQCQIRTDDPVSPSRIHMLSCRIRERPTETHLSSRYSELAAPDMFLHTCQAVYRHMAETHNRSHVNRACMETFPKHVTDQASLCGRIPHSTRCPSVSNANRRQDLSSLSRNHVTSADSPTRPTFDPHFRPSEVCQEAQTTLGSL